MSDRTIIEFADHEQVDPSRSQPHKTYRTFVNGRQVRVAKDGVRVETLDGDATRVHLTLLPDEVHFHRWAAVMTEPVYEWDITVLRYNTYGDRVVAETPVTIRASTKVEVTEKVRKAFGATYDDFREFWSHGWRLKEMREVASS